MEGLHKFLFDGLAVRGMLVRLEGSWRELLSRRSSPSDGGHAFAPPVRRLLGEMAAASCLMQANLKFDGALILQLHGDGPVKLAVAEAHPDLRFRATAKVVGPVADDARLEAMLNPHGQGRCAITLDPRERQPGQQPYRCTATGTSRCRPWPRCSSTTCCSPSSSTPGSCWPRTTTPPPGC